MSYRRVDSRADAGRLFDRLKDHFGQGEVFMDVEGGIARGEDFSQRIDAALQEATALVVVIGKLWLRCEDAHGRTRLSNSDDWVRLEIKTALTRGILVMPVLVGAASPPSAEQLPEEIRMLARRQASEISDARWDYDVSQIIKALERVQGRWSRRRTRAAAATLGMSSLLALAWYQLYWQGPLDPPTPISQIALPTPAPTTPAPTPLPATAPSRPSALEAAPATPTPPAPAPQAKAGLFETHDVLGGYWHEQAFNAVIAFKPDGSVEGRYYQYVITGSWTPRSQDTLIFSVRTQQPTPGFSLQWESGMFATVTGNTLKLEWPSSKGKYDYLIRQTTP